MDLISKFLDLGFVPVLYGDVVLDMDDKIKMAVLSGDQIVKYMAENLKPKDVSKVLTLALKVRESGDIKDVELKNAASRIIRAIEMS